MGRRRQSGFFETLLKSLFGFGTTVHHETNWLGQKQTVVKHHDSGKTKTYTHGTGLFGNKTRTKTVKQGRVVEEGTIQENHFWSGATEDARKSDGTTVTRQFSPGLFRDHVTTREHGICFKCDGTGQKELSCRTCGGTGTFTFPNRDCRTCNGTGRCGVDQCRRCSGTGIYASGKQTTCNRCEGSGRHSVICNKCNGGGRFTKKSYR
jgi:hypothetical protein